MSSLVRTPDGRPVIPGCGTLPPLDDAGPSKQAIDRRERNTSKQSRQTTANRFGTLNGFVDCSMAGLSRVDLGTWVVLFRDTRNGIAMTSQVDIARRIGSTDRAVRSAIGKLAKLGLLVVVQRGGPLKGPSKYRVVGIGKRSS